MELNPYDSPREMPPPQGNAPKGDWFRNPWHPATLAAVFVGLIISILLFLLAGVIRGL